MPFFQDLLKGQKIWAVIYEAKVNPITEEAIDFAGDPARGLPVVKVSLSTDGTLLHYKVVEQSFKYLTRGTKYWIANMYNKTTGRFYDLALPLTY
jgi:hypothetical protein